MNDFGTQDLGKTLLQLGLIIVAIGIGLRLIAFILTGALKSRPNADATSKKNVVPKAEPDSSGKAASSPEAQTTSPPAIDLPVRDLPDPVDGDRLDDLDVQLQKAITELAENPQLRSIVTNPPWGWHPAEIRELPSAVEARRLVLTRFKTLLGSRGHRTMEASFRMRFADNDTSWDRGFGRPSSVLRVDFSLPGDKRPDGSKRWNYGVTVGKLSSGRFLAWEWGG